MAVEFLCRPIQGRAMISWGRVQSFFLGPPPKFLYIILLDLFKKCTGLETPNGAPTSGAPVQRTRRAPHLHGPGTIIP
jgi:hypothetical protein